MAKKEVYWELGGEGVAFLTLAAPERRNALTDGMARELLAVSDEIDADQSIGAVIVRGEGPYFCAGGDRSTLAMAGEDPASTTAFETMNLIYRSFVRIGQMEAPTVAAVKGGAVGAGLNLALATDLRVVSRTARFLSGFMPIGLHGGGGHSALLGRTGSRELAAAFVLFGEEVDGEHAAREGLAWEAVAEDEVDSKALQLAAKAGADPELARATARTFRQGLGPPMLSWPAALEVERASQMWSMRRKHLSDLGR